MDFLEALDNKGLQLWGIQVKHPCDEAQRENVFSLVTSSAADGLHRQFRNRAADVAVLFLQFWVWFYVAGVIEDDAAFL